MRYLVYIMLVWIPNLCVAQIYKYISTIDGLSNQKVYHIQKDSQGYMWFLTNLGLDRYDGSEMKHYKLTDPQTNFTPQTNLDWIYTDSNGLLWVIGNKGRVFQYDSIHDCFQMVYKPARCQRKESLPGIRFGYMDAQNRIWLCDKDSITLYHTSNRKHKRYYLRSHREITAVEQVDSTTFFIGTNKGLFKASLKNGKLIYLPNAAIDSISAPINELYYHAPSQKLFVGTFRKGLLVYHDNLTQDICTEDALNDVNITRITSLDPQHILIATDGRGVYKAHIDSCTATPYITVNYKTYNEMNGNNINDMYVDDKQRIWLSNYPNGITVRDNRYTHYKWIKHSNGNPQSLINNQVYSIVEDSDGDLWFGTSNGISLFCFKTRQWHSFFSAFDKDTGDKNHIFLALCEIAPHIIWAGGYNSGIYQINKKDMSIRYLSPLHAQQKKTQPDPYIRSIKKDSEGYIWSGGYSTLERIDLKNTTTRSYQGLSSITAIIEKDKEQMWIGTTCGLYLLDKKSGRYKAIDLPVESMHICALCQKGSKLYVGTYGSGLVVYDFPTHTTTHYHTKNCALISNNIYTILANSNGNILLGTENGIVNFLTNSKQFHNWTKEQGLMSTNFNPGAGLLRRNNQVILGSNDGCIEFPANILLPAHQTTHPLLLSDLCISYQPVYPGDPDSPLKHSLNHTQNLKLKYEQNTFSIKVSSIDYDYPSNILYLWKLDGFYNEWSSPTSDNRIQFTNLTPGKYTLHIRAISAEETYKTYDERTLHITIGPPLWFSPLALCLYLLFFLLIAFSVLRIITLRREKELSDKKTRFFINTAHDIRTPLTMIKAPLEEILEKEQVQSNGLNNLHLAMKNVDALMRLTNNLINFEKVSSGKLEINIAEYNLGDYLTEIYQSFCEYADMRKIHFTKTIMCSQLTVWLDKEKMDSILKNLISNAIKYTPEGGSVTLTAYESKDNWHVTIEDSGMGIPTNDQKRIFKSYFRASNVVNLKISGSGIGLMLVYRLVKLHRGKIRMNSVEQQGTTVKISFPKGKKKYSNAPLLTPGKEEEKKTVSMLPKITNTSAKESNEQLALPRILIVEDNDDLRNYLTHILGENYRIQSCNNGKEALLIIEEFNPSLILSDIMMPEMRGDELCANIKNRIETSHIPVILLTALGDERSIIEGLHVGADDYITKPFSTEILKASIDNVLANRALLRKKYGNLDMDSDQQTLLTYGNDLNAKDFEFITAVKKNIENNLANANFSVDTLCAMHHMSRTSFFNKLKALTGQSPSDLIRIIRLRRASQLLREGYSVVEVSDMCGFCDTKYFREVFKKYYKENPSQHGKPNAPNEG